MGILDRYLERENLKPLPKRIKRRLESVEREMDSKVKGDSTFEQCITTHQDDLLELIDRVSDRISGLSVGSLSEIFNLLRFVKNIAFEIHQLVSLISDCVVPDDLGEEEHKNRRVELGRDLTYFVWLTVDPLAQYFKWLPFKRVIEKKVVRWLAGMSIEFAIDLFDRNEIQPVVKEGVTKQAVTIAKAV